MTGPLVHDCSACDGMGFGRCEETGARVTCEGCDGAGRMVECAECREMYPLPEAERHGMYCDGCRARLDARDHDEERRVRIAS